MKIFVINLEDRADRRESVIRQLDPLGVDYQFFEAISVADNPDQYFSGQNDWLTLMETQRRSVPAEIACYASHLLLWKKCIALNEPIVILEDDFLVTESFFAGLQFVTEHIEEYGFIRMEPVDENWPLRVWQEPEVAFHAEAFKLLFQVTVSLRATGYALSPAVAERFIATSSKYQVPVDHFFRRQWVHRLPLFALEPPAIELGDLADSGSIEGRDRIKFRGFLRRARKFYLSWAKRAIERVNRDLHRDHSDLFKA